MALGILFIFYAAIALISMALIVASFAIKSKKAQRGVRLAGGLYSLALAFINYLGLPSNYIGEQILTWTLAIPAIIGIVLLCCKQGKHSMVGGLCVATSIAACTIYMWI